MASNPQPIWVFTALAAAKQSKTICDTPQWDNVRLIVSNALLNQLPCPGLRTNTRGTIRNLLHSNRLTNETCCHQKRYKCGTAYLAAVTYEHSTSLWMKRLIQKVNWGATFETLRRKFSALPAVCTPTAEYAFDEVLGRAQAVATSLLERRVRPGEPVAIFLPNEAHPRWRWRWH